MPFIVYTHTSDAYLGILYFFFYIARHILLYVIFIRVRARTHTRTVYIYVYVRAHTHTHSIYICVCMWIHVLIYTHVCMHVRMHAYTYTHTHTHTHTHTLLLHLRTPTYYAYTHTHTHTHTHTQHVHYHQLSLRLADDATGDFFGGPFVREGSPFSARHILKTSARGVLIEEICIGTDLCEFVVASETTCLSRTDSESDVLFNDADDFLGTYSSSSPTNLPPRATAEQPLCYLLSLPLPPPLPPFLPPFPLSSLPPTLPTLPLVAVISVSFRAPLSQHAPSMSCHCFVESPLSCKSCFSSGHLVA